MFCKKKFNIAKKNIFMIYMNVMNISPINNFNIRQNFPKMNNGLSVSFGAEVIYMIDENGNISKYTSMKEVAVALGVSVETIKKALEQNKKVSGVTIKKG